MFMMFHEIIYCPKPTSGGPGVSRSRQTAAEESQDVKTQRRYDYKLPREGRGPKEDDNNNSKQRDFVRNVIRALQ